MKLSKILSLVLVNSVLSSFPILVSANHANACAAWNPFCSSKPNSGTSEIEPAGRPQPRPSKKPENIQTNVGVNSPIELGNSEIRNSNMLLMRMTNDQITLTNDEKSLLKKLTFEFSENLEVYTAFYNFDGQKTKVGEYKSFYQLKEGYLYKIPNSNEYKFNFYNED